MLWQPSREYYIFVQCLLSITITNNRQHCTLWLWRGVNFSGQWWRNWLALFFFFFCLFVPCVTEDWWYEGIYFNYTAANEINTTTKTTTPNMGSSLRYIVYHKETTTATTINTQHFESLRQLSVSKVHLTGWVHLFTGKRIHKKKLLPCLHHDVALYLFIFHFFWQKPGKGNNFWWSPSGQKIKKKNKIF